MLLTKIFSHLYSDNKAIDSVQLGGSHENMRVCKLTKTCNPHILLLKLV